jgi:drug/metabolite transporter (DMT)-like permease
LDSTAVNPDAAAAARKALRGRLWVALAAVLWSSSGLFAKATIFDEWPDEWRGIVLAFWRAAFAGVLLLPGVRRPQWDVRLVPLCLAFTAMNVTYLSAMTLTTAANAIWLQSTAPWWVLLFGVAVLGEPFPRSERAPLVVGGLGLLIILWFEIQGEAPAGVVLGLISGMSYSGVVLSLRALRGLDTVWIVAVAHLVTAAAIFPLVAYAGIWPTAAQVPVLAGFGLFQMALPYVFFGRGLRAITSQEATVIGLLEPILLPVWVYLAWGEVPAPWTLVGGGLILAGLALRYAVPLVKRGATSNASRPPGKGGGE